MVELRRCLEVDGVDQAPCGWRLGHQWVVEKSVQGFLNAGDHRNMMHAVEVDGGQNRGGERDPIPAISLSKPKEERVNKMEEGFANAMEEERSVEAHRERRSQLRRQRWSSMADADKSTSLDDITARQDERKVGRDRGANCASAGGHDVRQGGDVERRGGGEGGRLR